MTTQLSLGIALEIWGVIICLACIFVTMEQRSIFAKRNVYLMILFIINAIMLTMDAIGRAYQAGTIATMGTIWVKVVYFLVFETGYLLPVFFTLYVMAVVEEKKARCTRVYIIAEILVLLAGTTLLILTQHNEFYYYFDENMVYHRNPGFSASMGLGIIGIALVFFLVVCYHKSFSRGEISALHAYMIFPVIALAIQITYQGISLLNIATTASLLFIFIAHEMEISRMLQEKQEQLFRTEQEASERRYQLLQSQIEPHFLFNSLSSICAMCEDKKAVDVLQNFSKYLRMNMEAINRDENILFSKEIEHVQAYLSIELLRFDERLNVEFTLEEEDFMIPPLVVETIVENAVKHGIAEKRGGGTVWISSHKVTDQGGVTYEVVVRDDGVGFAPEQPKDDGRSHIGIENVRQRIESRCNGTLEIASKPGEGTTVTMRFPA